MTDKTRSNNSLNAQQVADYLQANPHFFVEQRKLLGEMHLPHDSGKAVSLIERQVAVLRERNMDMRHRLGKLLDNARENDRLFDKTKRLVLALIEGQDMGDIVDALYYGFDKEFDIHYTSLLLFGYVNKVPSSQARVVTVNEARENIPDLLKSSRATCGRLGDKEKRFLFGKDGAEVGSVATIPLMHGTAFGLLAIGNRDPDYYRSSMGTLFLGYIAEVLNRLLPRHLPRG